MFDQGAGIGDDSTGGAADMRVDFEDLLDGLRHDERGVEPAFDGQDHSLGALDADGRGAELNEPGCTLMASMAY